MVGGLGRLLTFAVSGLAGVAIAAPTIPSDKRIEAAIETTLSAPADQPMHMPTDVAVDRAGRLFVADGANDRIVRFAADGRFGGAIGKIGKESLSRPVGLAVDASDRLWIADTGNHRVLVASSDGELAETIALPALEGGHAFDVTDVLVTADGRRTYVVDNDNHRIVIRNNRDGLWATLGSFGRSLGQFQWPFMMCIGSQNDLYVTEAIGARIQRISPTDRWAGQVGRWGVELGQLYRPKGIAADGRGRLYVGDSSLGVIQVFSERGTVEGVLTDPQSKPLAFEHPMGMCLDAAGRLYVVELGADRVALVLIRSPAPGREGTGP